MLSHIEQLLQTKTVTIF